MTFKRTSLVQTDPRKFLATVSRGFTRVTFATQSSVGSIAHQRPNKLVLFAARQSDPNQSQARGCLSTQLLTGKQTKMLMSSERTQR